MGYFKNEKISQQAEVDEIVSWYKYHEANLPQEDFALILQSERLLEMSLTDWKLYRRPWVPRRKKASEHVALHETRKSLRVARDAQRATKRLMMATRISWTIAAVCLIVIAVVLVSI